VKDNAEQAMRLRTVIPAPVRQDAGYRISAINGDSIEVSLESGGESRKINRRYFNSGMRLIDENSGSIGRAEFNDRKGKSVAKMTAFVYLHPHVSWAGERNEFIRTIILGRDADERPATTRSQLQREQRAILIRRGQQRFRDSLLREYQNRCCVTGTTIIDVLQAAHIRPFSDDGPDLVENGLLLRSDIHDLFDLDEIVIDPKTLAIYFNPPLDKDPTYAQFHNKQLPATLSGAYPSRVYLEYRWARRPWKVENGE
jgi:HNH endonuclease